MTSSQLEWTTRSILRKLRVALGVHDQQVGRLEEIERLMKEFMGILQFLQLLNLPENPTELTASLGDLPSSARSDAVRYLVLEGRDDGTFVYSLDGGESHPLAPRLAELLKFLSSADLESDRGGGALVGFRSRSEILAHIEKHGKRTYHPRYVNNLVNGLRRALHKHDARELIVTNRQKGVRFLYKRESVRDSN